MLFDQNGGTTGIPPLRCCAAAAVIILRGTREMEKAIQDALFLLWVGGGAVSPAKLFSGTVCRARRHTREA